MVPLNNPHIRWQCTICGKQFPATPEFWYWDAKRDRYMRPCKTCCIKRVQGRRAKNRRKDRHPPDDCKPPGRKHKPVSRAGEQVSLVPLGDSVVASWAKRASQAVRMRNKRKFPSSDTVSALDILAIHNDQHGRCHYTGLPYIIGAKQTGSSGLDPLAASVDRIDSKLGYQPGNVVICCWFVNCAKNAWSLDLIKPLWRYLPTD